MEERKIGFLEESFNKKSSARLIFVIGSVWAMFMTYMLSRSTSISVAELIAFYTAIQGTLVGVKLGQRPMENKNSE